MPRSAATVGKTLNTACKLSHCAERVEALVAPWKIHRVDTAI